MNTLIILDCSLEALFFFSFVVILLFIYIVLRMIKHIFR